MIRAMAYSHPEMVKRIEGAGVGTELLLTQWPKMAEGAGMTVIPLVSSPEEQGVFMYQSVQGIIRQIRFLTESSTAASHHSGCIAVFSPLGRCGKTTLARALVQEKPAGKALYIGMEEYSDRPVHSDLLYRVKQRTPGLPEAAAGEVILEDGIMSLYPAGSYLEWRDVQSEDIRWLFEQLRDGGTETVVMDLGGAVPSELSLLTAFDRILMPVREDVLSGRKVEMFLSLLEEQGLAETAQRIRKVEVPAEFCDPPDYPQVIRCIYG